MRRDTIAAMVLAIGGVLALAVAGATIDDLREEGDGGGGGEGEGPQAPPDPDRGAPAFDVVPTIPGELIMLVLLVLMTVLLIVYLIRNWQEAAIYLAVAAIIFVALLLFFHFFPWDPDLSPADEIPMENVSPGEGEGGGDGGPQSPPVIGEWFPVFLLLGGLAVVAVAVSVLASRGGDEPEPAPTETPGTSDPDLAADLGAAAGRAADRLESDEGRENEVYRAWIEMVELLDAGDPQSTTPGGFAREAARAGIAADDVSDLTSLFEEVRYGDRPATERREREAIELLRRIEDRYATEAGTDRGVGGGR